MDSVISQSGKYRRIARVMAAAESAERRCSRTMTCWGNATRSWSVKSSSYFGPAPASR